MDTSVRQKKSKKSKHASSEALNGPLVDANASGTLVSEHKHLKKRKCESQLEDTVVSGSDAVAHPTKSTDEVDISEKKKKRRKEKDDDSSAPITQFTDSAAALSKKERKEKKKRERERADAIKATAEASFVVRIYVYLFPDRFVIF
jgi:hypothetical protein